MLLNQRRSSSPAWCLFDAAYMPLEPPRWRSILSISLVNNHNSNLRRFPLPVTFPASLGGTRNAEPPTLLNSNRPEEKSNSLAPAASFDCGALRRPI